MTPFWAWAVRCVPCLAFRDREVPATNLVSVRTYPGAVEPLCDHCDAGQEDPRCAE